MGSLRSWGFGLPNRCMLNSTWNAIWFASNFLKITRRPFLCTRESKSSSSLMYCSPVPPLNVRWETVRSLIIFILTGKPLGVLLLVGTKGISRRCLGDPLSKLLDLNHSGRIESCLMVRYWWNIPLVYRNFLKEHG